MLGVPVEVVPAVVVPVVAPSGSYLGGVLCPWLVVRLSVAWCMKGGAHLLLHFRLVPFSKKMMHLCRDPKLNLRPR